jgi:hypothetical protein
MRIAEVVLSWIPMNVLFAARIILLRRRITKVVVLNAH